jgi:isochorismate synthase
VIADAQPTTLSESLRRHCVEAVERAKREARPVVVSLTVDLPSSPDPVQFFARGERSGSFRSYWEQRSDGLTFVGIGVARAIRCDGSRPIRDAAAAVREDMATALIDDATGITGGPVYLGGFAFAPDRPAVAEWSGFPSGLLVLPRLLLAVRAGTAALTLSTLVEPDADPDVAAATALRDFAALRSAEPARGKASGGTGPLLAMEESPTSSAWKTSVAASVADIRSGRFEKVVLARSLRLRAGAPFDPVAILHRLRDGGPSAYVFAIETAGRCFLGASPERLVRLARREVEVTCLAGSIARGGTEAEDERLARELLTSDKNRTEHEVVVRSTQAALAAVCADVQRDPGTPWVARSRSVQHLATPLRGCLAHGGCVLDLVDRLHPTPAVGGFPRDVALAAIRDREAIARGWYAGPVGWVNRSGEGEFAVAIRSALVAGREATLYAGAGIVADSDPEAEYAETRLKLEPMLAALGAQ